MVKFFTITQRKRGNTIINGNDFVFVVLKTEKRPNVNFERAFCHSNKKVQRVRSEFWSLYRVRVNSHWFT